MIPCSGVPAGATTEAPFPAIIAGNGASAGAA